jgi:hypothetical protein
MLDSQIDFSDVSGLPYNKARESSMSKKTYKSRQGTADLAHYNTEMKQSHIRSPRDTKMKIMSQRSGSINMIDPNGNGSQL